MSTSSRVSDAESVAADRLMSLAALFEQKSKPAAKEEPPPPAAGSSTEAKPQPQHVDSSSKIPTKKSPGTGVNGACTSNTASSANPKSTAGGEKKALREHTFTTSQNSGDLRASSSPGRTATGATSTTSAQLNGRPSGSAWVRKAMTSSYDTSTTGNKGGSLSTGSTVPTIKHHTNSSAPRNYKTSSTNGTTHAAENILSSGTNTSNSPKKGLAPENNTSGAGTSTLVGSPVSGIKSANQTAAEAKKLDTDRDHELPKQSGGHHHVGTAAVVSSASPERRPSAVGSGGQQQQQQVHPQLSAPGKDGDRRPSLPRTYFVTHDYVDHANVRCEDVKDFEASIPKRSNRGGVKSLFPEKLHSLLSMGDEHVDPSIISWAPHGRCFSVHNVREFTRELMPRYFNHTAITSFQRQLNLYGFKRITKTGSKDQGAYYHELFLRGRPMLCRRMRRQKIKGTGYKPLPDPDNEPDFYSMEPCYEDDLKDQKAPSDDESPVLSQIKRGGKFDLASLTGGAGAGVAGAAAAAAAAGVGARRLDHQEAHKKAQAQAAIKGDEPPSKKPRTGVSAELSNYLPHNRDILASPRQGGGLGSDAASQVLRQAAVRNAAAASQAGAGAASGGAGGPPESPYGALGGGRGAMGMVPTSPNSIRANAALHSRLQASLAGPAHAQDSSQVVLEQLLSRVYGGGGGGASGAGGRGGGPAPPEIVESARTSRTALQEEIEMLEATRRNVMLQQQRLEMLLAAPGGSAGGAAAARAGLGGPPPPSAASQQHSYHLGQLAAAYDGASSGAPPPPSRGEQLARTLAGLDRAAVSSPGAETTAGGAAGAAGGEGSAGRPALVKALEDLLAAGRISNEQLAGIESILGRPPAPPSTAGLQQQQPSSALSGLAARYGRNRWI